MSENTNIIREKIREILENQLVTEKKKKGKKSSGASNYIFPYRYNLFIPQLYGQNHSYDLPNGNDPDVAPGSDSEASAGGE